ncbi:MAG TPA: ferrochelatase [Thermodesulfovibrionales bacterium]|nr:ferrochelatase [Thermodesulfovibrionales bacterium]
MGEITLTNNAPQETIGVILLNLGGPDSIQAVKPFLYNLFSDRQIIQLGPPFMQRPLARLISGLRSKKTEKYYGLIGGRSPIVKITAAQAAALETELNSSIVTDSLSPAFRVYTGMRYWHPLIEDVIPGMKADGIKKIIGLGLYPQYSVATSGSSFSKFDEVVSLHQMEALRIESWHNNPHYIDALVYVIKQGLGSFPPSSVSAPSSASGEIHVLFSAHSLPKKIIDQGDPYVDQIKGTISEILKKMDIKWHLSYQSKSGPVKWLEPSTEEKIRELAKEGVRNLLVVPISFVSDHIETLYEIDILYRDFAESLGIHLRRVESLNTLPLFIKALKDVVLGCMASKGWF